MFDLSGGLSDYQHKQMVSQDDFRLKDILLSVWDKNVHLGSSSQKRLAPSGTELWSAKRHLKTFWIRCDWLRHSRSFLIYTERVHSGQYSTTDQYPNRESACAIGHVQALPVAIDEGLEQRLVVGDGLQYVAIVGHIADGPLAQSRTAQSEDVTVRQRKRSAGFTHTNCKSANMYNKL